MLEIVFYIMFKPNNSLFYKLETEAQRVENFE